MGEETKIVPKDTKKVQVTPGDIKEMYFKKQNKELEDLFFSSIDYINKELKDRTKEIIKYGYIKISIKNLSIRNKDADNDIDIYSGDEKWSPLFLLLQKFFTSWNLEYIDENSKFKITPISPIDSKLNVNFKKLMGEETKGLGINEIIKSRSEILDLE